MQDVKAYLSQLIRKAEAGETVILTGHGEPTVRLLVELQGEGEPLRTRH